MSDHEENNQESKMPRSGKIYEPSDDNKKEIGSKAYWAGFKLWIMLIVVGVILWFFEMGIDPNEFPTLFSIVSSTNSYIHGALNWIVWLVEPNFETFGSWLYEVTKETGFADEIIWALTGLIGLFLLGLVPYVFYPMYYPWAKSQIALNHHCDSCGKDWTVYWTGEQELYDVGKSYTNTTETEQEFLGDRERTVDKQQEYTDRYFNYEFLCKHCGQVEYRQGVESSLSNETVTARSNWQKKS